MTISKQSFSHKHLLGIKQLNSTDIQIILQRAQELGTVSPEDLLHRYPSLSTKLIINLFFEGSTRTRSSFEVAEKRLGLQVVNFNVDASSSNKGETLLDTAKNLEAVGAGLMVVRHPSSGVPDFLSRHLGVSIINAGDGSHEHPTQALLDAYTLKQHFGEINNLRIAIVGDIRNSRVARSNVWLLGKLGAKVTLVAPPTLLPNELKEIWPSVELTSDFDGILPYQDAFMMLRIQSERGTDSLIPKRNEYTRFYRLDEKRLSKAPSKAVVLHPGPINHNVEITTEVAESSQSLILKQVSNGVLVRMAVISLLGEAL